jgi:hypothetical protein
MLRGTFHRRLRSFRGTPSWPPLDELRTVVHGLFPALLQRRGLVPALASHLQTNHPQAMLAADGIDERLDHAIEAAGYLFCSQVAPQDTPCRVHLQANTHRLHITISWDAGPDPRLTHRTRWQRAIDRVEAVDGTVTTKDTETAHPQRVVRADIPLHPVRFM